MVEVTGQSLGAGGNVIDINNPLYIHPSDNPSLILVPVSFEGVGYRSWRRGVMRSLSVKNKLGFITGEFKRPSSTSPQFRQWERCDNMIQKDINDLSQGVLDVNVYYTRMKKLWEELSNLSINNQCSCTCSCGGKEVMHKAEQDRRLIQFLMGLNEVYTVIRGNILMMNPLPSMAQAFALLVQEEKQREFKPHSQMFAEGSSLNSSLHVGSSNQSCGRVNSTTASSSNSTGGRCYKLHGYPNQNNTSNGQGFNQQRYNNAQNQRIPANYNASNRYAKGKGVAPNAFADPNMGETDASNPTCNANLTNEQCGQLINLLQHIQLGKYGDVDSEEQGTCGAANFRFGFMSIKPTNSKRLFLPCLHLKWFHHFLTS
ncbi:hypothetical protein EJD97_017268, partial [Solanum chilense]